MNNNVAHKRLISMALWLAALALLLWALRTVPLTAVLLSLQQLELWQVGVLVLLNALVLALLTARWWLILWKLGYKLPFGLTMAHRLAAFGVTYFTPGPQFGGEPVQVLLVEKGHGVPRITAVSSVALDKTVELLVNFSFLVLGVVMVGQARLWGEGEGWQTAASARSVQAVLALALLGIPVFYLAALWRGNQPVAALMRLARPVFSRRSTWIDPLEAAVRGMAASEKQAGQFCHQAPGAMWAALLVSLLGWLVMVLEFGLMLTFLGASVSFWQVVVVLTAVRFAYLLPFPGGLGTLEAAQVLALTQLGFDPAVGLSASLLIRGRDVLLALGGLWWGNHFLTGLIYQASQKEISDDQFT